MHLRSRGRSGAGLSHSPPSGSLRAPTLLGTNPLPWVPARCPCVRPPGSILLWGAPLPGQTGCCRPSPQLAALLGPAPAPATVPLRGSSMEHPSCTSLLLRGLATVATRRFSAWLLLELSSFCPKETILTNDLGWPGLCGDGKTPVSRAPTDCRALCLGLSFLAVLGFPWSGAVDRTLLCPGQSRALTPTPAEPQVHTSRDSLCLFPQGIFAGKRSHLLES